MVDVTLEAAAQWQNKLNGFAASPLRSRIDGFRPILSSMGEVCLDNPAALQMNTLTFIHTLVGSRNLSETGTLWIHMLVILLFNHCYFVHNDLTTGLQLRLSF
jgi:hypothetical protein